MSRINLLTRAGFKPFMKGTNIQQYLCDKGGGLQFTRYESSSPCETQGGEVERMSLKCKVALVTGGATGIGFATAHQLLNEGLYRVVIADLDPCTGLKAAQRLADVHGENKCCFMPLNVCCAKQMEDVMNKVKSTFTRLDIVVNNAAIVDNDNIDLEMDTNLRSILHGTKSAVKIMKQQKEGLIVNIGDTKGLSSCTFFPSYAAEKSGVHKWSMGLGQESNPIRIIALAPGLTETEMGEKFKDKPIPACMQQQPCDVGKAVVHTAKYADSGSLWVVEQKKLYKANWPDKSTYLQFIIRL